MSKLSIKLQNQTKSNTVWAYVTGHDIHRNNDWFLLQADGVTPYYPANPPERLSPLLKDCAIPLNAPGKSPKVVSVPKLATARIYFSITNKMTFYLNAGPALVEPDINNPNDPNVNIQWDFCEFTFNDTELFCNITYVDFVSLPISLTLVPTTGPTQHVTGFPADGFAQIQQKLEAQGQVDRQPWGSLLRRANGKDLRILNPKNAIVADGSLFAGYFEPYIDQVWTQYASPAQTLSIATGMKEWGTATGYVDPTSKLLTFPSASGPPGSTITFSKPSTKDVFSCDTGPFHRGNDEAGNISARIAAAFNRTTVLKWKDQPGQPAPAQYYKDTPTNHYSRIVHEVNTDHLGYTFPFDDVRPSEEDDQSGKVQSGNVKSFTVTVGASGVAKKEL
ncbi:MAG: hypothetical protein LQ342_005504 [Letrouitia transgressa]|nr:MAG: hypothetical protein LQ342_005504 [Letrouitia transgressa]